MPTWFEQCFVWFTWPLHGLPMTRAWVSGVIDRALSLGAEAMIFGVQMGGYAAYRSELLPPIPGMEGDVLEHLCDEGHARSLRIVPMFISTNGGCLLQAREHPDWQALGPDGRPTFCLCYSSPFGDFTEAQIRDLLSRYPVDGLYLDQLSVACWCPWCQENFRRQHGFTMPRPKNPAANGGDEAPGPAAQELDSFYWNAGRSLGARVRRSIAQVRKDTVYIQNCSPPDDPASRGCAEFADALLAEYHGWTVRSLGLHHRLVRAHAGKPVWANVSHVFTHHAITRPVEHTELLLMEGVSARCCPTVIELNALDSCPNRRADLALAFRRVRWSSDAQRGTRPMRYAALLHSINGDAAVRAEHLAELTGYYDVLGATHVPVEVVTERSVQRNGLDGFRVLLVPDAVCLADETVNSIRKHVDAGGGLVVTYRSGERNADGKWRALAALSGITGARPLNTVTFDADRAYPSLDSAVNIPSIDLAPGSAFFRYARAVAGHPAVGALSDELLAFRAGYVEALYDTGVATAAWVLNHDQVRINMQPYNRRGLFPGDPLCPLVVTREPAGRVAYVAAALGQERARSMSLELDRLIRDLTVWAADRAPPLSADDLPSSVHVSLGERADGDRVITITNQTTGVIRDETIRRVVPLNDLSFRVEAGNVRDIDSASGRARLAGTAEGWVTIQLPRLGVSDCIVLRSGGNR